MSDTVKIRRLQRAANAAAESARRTTGKPAKPWRVYGGASLTFSEDYRSQIAAYEAVQELTGPGHAATVYHWEDGRWVLYEVIEPATRVRAPRTAVRMTRGPGSPSARKGRRSDA